MTHHTIRQGLDIPLKGAPGPNVEEASSPSTIALRTAESIGFKFKVDVAEGESVALGQVLCHTRQFPEIVFRSPAGGKVREIRRGERRAIQEIVIDPDQGDEQSESFETWTASSVESADPEALRKHLLDAGMWPLIQQRPLAKIANPNFQPAAVFINAMATAPLAAQSHVLLEGREEDFALGVAALQRMCSGKTYLTVGKGDPGLPGMDALKNVEVHTFSGPHPSGLPGVHIRKIQPMKQNEYAWCLKAEDAADIGYLLRTGVFPVERVIALSGSPVTSPGYLRTRAGADIATITAGKLDTSGPLRYLNGDVLAGTITTPENHLGIHHSTLTVIPEGDDREFMGWAMPGFTYFSALRTFASSLLPRRQHVLDTRLNGGIRPIVSIGQWEKVFPYDIHLSYLIRAIQAEDVQEAESLGLLELAEEDVALCAFIDPSKMEISNLIRHGLNLYEAENL